MAWLIAPPIEELAKALPVIVLAFLTREARRLSIADLTLIGFASGAGFGFVEGNLNALVNGTLPGFTHLAALGLQTGDGGVFFAGHAVATALVGLAAGIGLRFLPLKVVYAWAPSAFVILWASFDHGIYNWKLLNADSAGALPNAHFAVELLHTATLKGQLATWLLPLGLIVAQFFEAYLCSKAVGARRDLLLAREWRPWVVNEWLVALLRAPLGRAAFGETLAYFRLRRAFYLASFEARRDTGDPTWTRHARALEERLKRERSILFDPPPGTWLLPFPVLKTYAAEWTWRMRWVLLFAVLFVLLFLLGPRSLPEWLRQVLYGDTFTIAIVIAGLAFAVWRILLFIRQPQPDPLAAEGAAYAGYYTRALLLGCSFVCGLFPAAALLFGWNAFAPGAAFLSGYLPGWIAQGGNLQTLLGLGAVGSAVAPDPRPTGEAYRHEIAAADERLRRLAVDIEDTTGTAETASPGSGRPLQLEAFLGAMAKLDAERDAQARRQLVLDECERHAGEATITDPAPAAQAVKEEFDRLASELLDAAAKELDAIASIEQAYGRAWAEIMQDLDAHDALRRRLSVPLRAAWQAQDDIGWALRVVEATDEGLLPMQLTLLSELHAVATSAQGARTDMVAAGIERIREAAAQYGEEDPFAFAGTEQADDDEAALLAEFASSAPSAETPKAFGLRTPQPVEPPAAQPDDLSASAKPRQSEPNRVQKALDQLIGSTESDERYLETIRHLERSTEALRQPLEPVEAEPRSTTPLPVEEETSVAQDTEHKDELENLIDAIKRDSGYLDFTKDALAAESDEERVEPQQADAAPEARDAPAVAEEHDTLAVEVPTADEEEAPAESVVASAPTESADERIKQEETVSVPAPEPIVASLSDTPDLDLAQTADDALALEIEEPITVGEPVADVAPLEPAPVPNAAPTPEPAVAGDESVQEQAAVEPFALVVEDEPAVDAEETQPAAAPVTREQGEQLALPLSPVRPEAPREVFTSRTETSGRIDVEQPAPVEPHRPTVEPARSREADESASKAEIRSSLFTRLFQSIKRQSAEPAAKRSRWDEPKPVDTKPARPVVTPSIEDQPSALQPQTPHAEITATKAKWLADFAATMPEAAAARTDDTPLQPIEWPTLSRTVDVDDPTRDAAAERAAPVDTPAADDHAQAHDAVATAVEQADEVAPTVDAAPLEAPASDATDAVAATVTVDAVKSVEPETLARDAELTSVVDETEPAATAAAVDAVASVEPEASAHDAAASSVAEQSVVVEPAVTAAEPARPESNASVAPEITNTEVEKPQGDEFASKADRLSYLLTKLEQAIQAKTAAPEAPVPVADTAPSTPIEIAADSVPQSETSEAPIAVELEIEEPQQPVEQTPRADQPDETATTPVEVSVAPEQPAPIAGAQPPADEPSPVMTPSEPPKPTEARLKPDRLSYLLDKLFETAKREPAERPSVPRQADPEPVAAAELVPPVEAAPAHPAESEILDLRGPDPLPEPPDDEAEPSSAVAPPPPLEIKTEEPVHAFTAPIEAPVVVEPLQPAPIDTTPAETTQPSDQTGRAESTASARGARDPLWIALEAPAAQIGGTSPRCTTADGPRPGAGLPIDGAAAPCGLCGRSRVRRRRNTRNNAQARLEAHKKRTVKARRHTGCGFREEARHTHKDGLWRSRDHRCGSDKLACCNGERTRQILWASLGQGRRRRSKLTGAAARTRPHGGPHSVLRQDRRASAADAHDGPRHAAADHEQRQARRPTPTRRCLEHVGHVAPRRGRDPPEARLRTVHRVCSIQRDLRPDGALLSARRGQRQLRDPHSCRVSRIF